MSRTRFPVNRLSGTHDDQLLVMTLLPHGAGVREIGIEVPRATILSLAAILQYPCCQDPHSMPHALHHLNTGDPSCNSGRWFPPKTGIAFYITEGPLVHIGVNLPADGGRDSWVVELDVAGESFRSLQPSSSLPDKENVKQFLTDTNAKKLSAMVRDFLKRRDYTPQNVGDVWCSFVTGGVARDVELGYMPTVVLVSPEAMAALQNRRVRTREAISFDTVGPIPDLWPSFEGFLHRRKDKEAAEPKQDQEPPADSEE